MKSSIAAALLAAFFAFGVAAAAEPSAKDTLTKAHALIHNHDNKAAIALLDSLLRTDPKNVEALVTRGDAKDNIGQHIEALVDYNAAIELNPDYAYAYYSKCDTEVTIDRNNDAIADCTKSIELDNTDADAFVDRSFAYGNTERYPEAIKDATAALKLDSTSANAYNARCRAERLLKDYAAAQPDCMKSIALSPKYEQPVWGLAMIEYHLGRYDASAAHFEKALELDDTDDVSHYWAAKDYIQLKDYTKALAHISAYILKEQMDGDGYLERARIEAATGDKAAARSDLNQAVHLYKVANDQDGVANATQMLTALDKQ